MTPDTEAQPQRKLAAEQYTIFTPLQKKLIVFLVSIAATFSGFASNIYFPAIPAIASDLSVSSELVNLTVTSYLIFQGLSPTLWGAIADVHGRRVTYICTFIVFIGACVGLAETKNYAQLIVLRCVQSTGSASTVAIGAGVLGDITTREERGGYMGYFQAGLLLPVAIGPILGGVFSEKWGWRSVFWFLTAYGSAFLILLIVLLPETLRSLVGNGSLPPKGIAESPLAALERRRHASGKDAKVTPTVTSKPKAKINLLASICILVHPEVTCAVLFAAVHYTVWQMVITVTSTLFKQVYGLNESRIGLVFLANGVGCMIGTLSTGKTLDFDYRRMQKSFGGLQEDFPLEKARLRTIWLWGTLQCAAVITYGWTLQFDVHISVPIICMFILGWTAIAIYSAVSTYLVDIHPTQSASATATLNLVRCLMGAGGVAAAMPCVDAINIGWTFTLFTGIMLAAFGLMWIELVYGPRWRRKSEQKQSGG